MVVYRFELSLGGRRSVCPIVCELLFRCETTTTDRADKIDDPRPVQSPVVVAALRRSVDCWCTGPIPSTTRFGVVGANRRRRRVLRAPGAPIRPCRLCTLEGDVDARNRLLKDYTRSLTVVVDKCIALLVCVRVFFLLFSPQKPRIKSRR